MDSLGLTGGLVSLAGLALLWRARTEVLYWLRLFFRIFGHEVTRRGGLEDRERALPPLLNPLVGTAPPRRYAATIWLVGGLALMFLGQLLFVLDLVF